MEHVKGEKFDLINKSDSKDKVIDISDNEINERYLKGEIRIVTEQARYPLDTISKMLESGKYNLNPEYQRRKRWSVEQKSRLIESLIINVPIPPVFLYEVSFAEYEVMDGLQRLTAISEFYNDKYELKGLEQWASLNGRIYSKLPKKVREGIDRRYLSSVVLLNETAKTSVEADFLKQIVFERLNSGGDKLTAQETRNALHGGKFNNFCIELSRNDNFRNLWNYPLIIVDDNDNSKILNEKELLETESYRKMEDVELVLRFFAYRHLDELSNSGSQEKFLDNFLSQANSFSEITLNELRLIFEKTMDITFKVFGKSAFYMPDASNKKSTPTKTIYDSLMQSISKILDKEELIILNAKKIRDNKFKEKEKLIIKDKKKNNQLFDGKYNSKNNVIDRIKYFDNYLKEMIK